MKKWLLGLLLGGVLGIFDGLTAPLSAPETRAELGGIIIGSMIKGFIAGVLIGYFSQKVRSLTWGIVFGLAIGALLAFGVALMQYLSMGRNYWWQIMLPGALVGVILGYVTQQYGRAGGTGTSPDRLHGATARLLLIAFTLLSADRLCAADEPASPDKLAPLAPFAGEWQIDAKWSDGRPLHARNLYTWGLGKKIMTSKTFVTADGKEYQRYEGILAWHPDKKSLFHISFTYDGSLSQSIVEMPSKDTLHIGFVPFEAGKPSQVRQVIRFLDNDHFNWVVSLKDGDGWKQIMDGTWVRTHQ
jgi:hypothetical protein